MNTEVVDSRDSLVWFGFTRGREKGRGGEGEGGGGNVTIPSSSYSTQKLIYFIHFTQSDMASLPYNIHMQKSIQRIITVSQIMFQITFKARKSSLN